MSAQPEAKQDKSPRSQRTGSMDNRVVRLETRWETVIPNLVTKADLSDLRNDITSIKTFQDAHMQMTQDLKMHYDKLDSALDNIHAIQGQFSADLRALDTKIDTKIDAQTNKLLVQLPAIILAILGLFGVVMKFLPAASVQQPAPISAPVQAVVTPVQPAPSEGNP